MSYPISEKIQNIFSVLAGILVTLLTGLLTLPIALFLVTEIYNTNHAPNSEEEYKLLAETLLSFWLGICQLLGTLICVLISTRNDLIHSGICAIGFFAILLFSVFFTEFPSAGFIPFITIGLFTWPGYKLGQWLKGRKVRDTDSSLPDIP